MASYCDWECGALVGNGPPLSGGRERFWPESSGKIDRSMMVANRVISPWVPGGIAGERREAWEVWAFFIRQRVRL